jgi:hypothetical protein
MAIATGTRRLLGKTSLANRVQQKVSKTTLFDTGTWKYDVLFQMGRFCLLSE